MPLLTWREGPQSIGFTMAHSEPLLLIGGSLCWVGEIVWCGVMVWMGVAQRIPIATKYWAAIAVVLAVLVSPLVPYKIWQGLTTAVLGLSPKSNSILVSFAAEGDLAGVSSLLDKGIGVDATDSAGCSALVAAATANKAEVVVLLLQRGARVDRLACTGDTALHRAAMNGNEAIVKLLLAAHADVSIKNSNGFRAADLAWGAHHQAVADLIDGAASK